MSAEDRAVVVGISRYPSITPLNGPENDARAVRDWLVDPAGGDMPPEHVRCILSSDYDEVDDPIRAEPTVEDVRQAFEELLLAAREGRGRVGRRLYIYLAGHGIAPDVDDAALLGANADYIRILALSGVQVAAYFRKEPFFDEVVLLMDCCRDVSARLPKVPLPWVSIAREPHDARWFYGFATKWFGAAREKRMADGQVHGVFTHVVLEGLRGGHVTSDALERFVLARLPEVADRDGWQKPVFLRGTDEIRFAEAAAAPEALLRVRLKRPYRGVEVVVEDGALATVASAKPGREPWEVALEPGLYSVRRSDRPEPELVRLTAGVQDVAV